MKKVKTKLINKKRSFTTKFTFFGLQKHYYFFISWIKKNKLNATFLLISLGILLMAVSINIYSLKNRRENLNQLENLDEKNEKVKRKRLEEESDARRKEDAELKEKQDIEKEVESSRNKEIESFLSNGKAYKDFSTNEIFNDLCKLIEKNGGTCNDTTLEYYEDSWENINYTRPYCFNSGIYYDLAFPTINLPFMVSNTSINTFLLDAGYLIDENRKQIIFEGNKYTNYFFNKGGNEIILSYFNSKEIDRTAIKFLFLDNIKEFEEKQKEAMDIVYDPSFIGTEASDILIKSCTVDKKWILGAKHLMVPSINDPWNLKLFKEKIVTKGDWTYYLTKFKISPEGSTRSVPVYFKENNQTGEVRMVFVLGRISDADWLTEWNGLDGVNCNTLFEKNVTELERNKIVETLREHFFDESYNELMKCDLSGK